MQTSCTYSQCLEMLYGLRRFGIKLGLDLIRHILTGIGNPQQDYACIHIAGTNGKGSIASALAAILQEAGYRTGLYTSPHLVRFNERIQVDGVPISDAGVLEAFEAVRQVAPDFREATFFEYTTAMALYAFGVHKVDWAVIETGMGGRLDATNIIMPRLSLISNLSVEHAAYLGNTLEAIAFEKGGIIKDQTPVVTGVQQKNALAVLRKLAEARQAPFYRFREHFKVRRHADQTFDYYGLWQRWPRMRTGLQGNYQIDNAALVLAACEILSAAGAAIITPDHIRNGLLRHAWPGRLEIVSTQPHVLLDGAHNLAAARNLSQYLKHNFADRHITLIVGILDDKPYAAMLSHLAPLCRTLIATQPVIDRALTPEILQAAAAPHCRDIRVIPSVADALRQALQQAAKDDLICVAGSLYVVGEAKAFLSGATTELHGV